MHLGGLAMALTKIKLGKYIELYSEKCNIPNLTNDDVSGVNKEKEFLSLLIKLEVIQVNIRLFHRNILHVI